MNSFIAFLLKLMAFLILTSLGWFVISASADWYVLNHIRPKTGYYIAQSYTDFLKVYIALSTIFVLPFNAIESASSLSSKLAKIAFILFALFFVCIFIEDDIRAGRPILPELFFTVIIVVFHLLLLKLASRLGFFKSEHEKK